MLRTTVVVAGLAALAAGCASAPPMRAGEAIEKRKALMKDTGATWRSIQDKAKAGQVAAIAPDAEKLSANSRQIPGLFPAGSLDPAKSAAKPEIWQKRAEFDAAAKNLETWSNRLAAASKANNATETQAIMK
jgi:cytochrome c556